MKLDFNLYPFYWQIRKTLKNLHFSPLFFFLSQLVWPVINLGIIYFSYSPLMETDDPFLYRLSGGIDLIEFLLPGVITLYLYLEYITIGFTLMTDRDYGVLEPIFLSPVNRSLWLLGATSGAIPSALTGAVGFSICSFFIFGIFPPHPLWAFFLLFFVIIFSLPWGCLICAIFLSGRNSRLLYAIFETPSEFMSGARFPLNALPSLLSGLATVYPLSHAVKLLRYAFSSTPSLKGPLQEILWLTVLGVVYSAIALFLCRRAEKRGKENGTLCFT